MKRKYLRNPQGSRDWLPDEVIKQEFVRKSLVKVFELWGYQPIQTPILINYDLLTRGSGSLSDIAFKFIGKQGDVLALRADLTTPIARVTAERLKGKQLPHRFYYVGKVFRYHARKTTNESELYQIGIELIGAKEGYSDLECLKIFLQGLKKTGLKKYLIFFNHALLWSELLRCFGEVAQDLYKALKQKDFVSFRKILSESRLSKKEKDFWDALIKIRGNKESLKELRSLAKKVPRLNIGKVISYFNNLFEVLDENVQLDLSLTSDIDYYSGIYFEAITPYLGRVIGSGGRYDGLIGKFGLNLGAVGFQFCLEDLLLALENQGKVFPRLKGPKLIKASRNVKKTFQKINSLQGKGKCATLKL